MKQLAHQHQLWQCLNAVRNADYIYIKRIKGPDQVSVEHGKKRSGGFTVMHTSQLSHLRCDSHIFTSNLMLSHPKQILMPQIVYLQDLKYKYTLSYFSI